MVNLVVTEQRTWQFVKLDYLHNNLIQYNRWLGFVGFIALGDRKWALVWPAETFNSTIHGYVITLMQNPYINFGHGVISSHTR